MPNCGQQGAKVLALVCNELLASLNAPLQVRMALMEAGEREGGASGNLNCLLFREAAFPWLDPTSQFRNRLSQAPHCPPSVQEGTLCLKDSGT